MSFITDIANYIAGSTTIESAFGASITVGTNLFISFEPDTPNNCITIYPTSSLAPTDKDKYNSAVQVRVRATTFPIAYNTCQAIIDALHRNGAVLTNTNGLMLALNSQPIYLTRDTEKRTIVVANFFSRHARYT